MLEQVIVHGDLAKLTPGERVMYYNKVCESLGLNPFTKPFDYITLNGRLTLYARRDATDQLRTIHGISVTKLEKERIDDLYVVTAYGQTRDGRIDSATGAVAIRGLTGENLANALMKSECVPLTSQILTRDGFKYYDELLIGEPVLAYDLITDRCVWTALRHVTVYPEAPTVRFGTNRLGFRCTPDHSWCVSGAPYKPKGKTHRGPYSNRRPLHNLVKAVEVVSSHQIILAAPAEGGDSPLTPAEAALLGWVMCDGTIKRLGNHIGLGISQSKPDRIEEIESVLQVVGVSASRFTGKPTIRTFPTGNTYECLAQTWFYLSALDSRQLFEKAGISGPADMPRLVTRLTHEAREAMLAAMMAADGDARGVFGKKRKPGVMQAWQILSTLEGYALGICGKTAMGGVPVQRLRKRRHMAGANIRLSDPATESVWCPTTDYGTWVMRQGDNIVITGNSKAKRRLTLSLAGLGWTDESEVTSIPGAAPVAVDAETGEIQAATAPATVVTRPSGPADADPSPTSAVPDKRPISEPQRKRLWAICKQAGVTETALAAHLKALAIIDEKGEPHTSLITRVAYDAICAWAEHGGVTEAVSTKQSLEDQLSFEDTIAFVDWCECLGMDTATREKLMGAPTNDPQGVLAAVKARYDALPEDKKAAPRL